MKNAFFYVYILICDNEAYYTGYTVDLLRRYEQHVDGTGGCKFTRSFKPLGIAQSWRVEGEKGVAMRVERHIKGLSKADKEQLIRFPERLTEVFPEAKSGRETVRTEEI